VALSGGELVRKRLLLLAVLVAAVALAGCSGTARIARCSSGVRYIVPHVGKGGEGGSASLVVCKNGQVWRIDP
jgi:hypothetical protein